MVVGRVSKMSVQRRLAIAASLLLVVAPRGRVSARRQIWPSAPTLLVVLVVDQMGAGYVEAYGDQWTA
jgi:hypothetical protein